MNLGEGYIQRNETLLLDRGYSGTGGINSVLTLSEPASAFEYLKIEMGYNTYGSDIQNVATGSNYFNIYHWGAINNTEDGILFQYRCKWNSPSSFYVEKSKLLRINTGDSDYQCWASTDGSYNTGTDRFANNQINRVWGVDRK